MSTYTFQVHQAAVDIEADSEHEAREKYRQATLAQQEDIDYNGLSVYLPSWSELTLNEVDHDD